MLSVHTVVDLAFCAALLIGIWPISKFVFGILRTRRDRIAADIKDADYVRDQSTRLLNHALNKEGIDELNSAIEDVLQNARAEARKLVLNSKKDLENSLEEYLEFATKVISERIVEAVQALATRSVDIASIAATELMREYVEEQDKMMLADLSRDLNKKLD